MAHSLQMGCGSIALNFNGTLGPGTARLMGYTPQYGGNDADTIYEEARVQLIASSSDKLGTMVNLINTLFADVEKTYQMGQKYIGTISYLPDGMTTAKKASLLRSGELHLDDAKSMDAPWWGAHKIECTVGWTRVNYWTRMDASTTVCMNNANSGTPGYATTLGVANTGRQSGTPKLDNTITIMGTNIEGDLPSPACVAIYNAGTLAESKIYIGNNLLKSSVYGFAYDETILFREGEDAISYGGTAADANCSGSIYATNTAGTTETNLFTWRWTTDESDIALRGQSFHVLARFQGTVGLASTKFRLKLQSGNTTVWSGPQFRLNTPTQLIQDMGVVTMPNWGLGNTTTRLLMTGQTASGSGTINLDFIQLLGANYAALSGLNSLGTTDTLWFGESEKYYTLIHDVVADHELSVDWTVTGSNAVMLYPGYTNQITILRQSAIGTLAPVAGTVRVSMEYYPRYRTI